MRLVVGAPVRVSDDSSPLHGTKGRIQAVRKSEFYRGRKFLRVELDGHIGLFGFTCEQLALDPQATSMVKV